MTEEKDELESWVLYNPILPQKQEIRKTLYIFIDESGNFDFSSGGTKHFLLTAVSTPTPMENRTLILETRYNILGDGHDIEYFHATEDKQFVRDAVFNLLKQMGDFQIDYIYACKNRTHPTVRSPERFYATLLRTLLKYIFKNPLNAGYNNFVIVLGALFTGSKRA